MRFNTLTLQESLTMHDTMLLERAFHTIGGMIADIEELLISEKILSKSMAKIFKNVTQIILHEWLYSLKPDNFEEYSFDTHFIQFYKRKMKEGWNEKPFVTEISEKENVFALFENFYQTAYVCLSPLLDNSVTKKIDSTAFAHGFFFILLFWIHDPAIKEWIKILDTKETQKEIREQTIEKILEKTFAKSILHKIRKCEQEILLARDDILKNFHPLNR